MSRKSKHCVLSPCLGELPGRLTSVDRLSWFGHDFDWSYKNSPMGVHAEWIPGYTAALLASTDPTEPLYQSLCSLHPPEFLEEAKVATLLNNLQWTVDGISAPKLGFKQKLFTAALSFQLIEYQLVARYHNPRTVCYYSQTAETLPYKEIGKALTHLFGASNHLYYGLRAQSMIGFFTAQLHTVLQYQEQLRRLALIRTMYALFICKTECPLLFKDIRLPYRFYFGGDGSISSVCLYARDFAVRYADEIVTLPAYMYDYVDVKSITAQHLRLLMDKMFSLGRHRIFDARELVGEGSLDPAHSGVPELLIPARRRPPVRALMCYDCPMPDEKESAEKEETFELLA